MSTEISTMKDLETKIAEDIKVKFASMIPPEVFDRLTRSAIKDFFETEIPYTITKVNNGSYYTEYEMRDAMSPFKVMIFREVQKMVKDDLTRWIEENKNALVEEINALFKEEHQNTLAFLSSLNMKQLSLQMASNMQQRFMQDAASQVGYALSAVNTKISELAALNNLHLPASPL